MASSTYVFENAMVEGAGELRARALARPLYPTTPRRDWRCGRLTMPQARGWRWLGVRATPRVSFSVMASYPNLEMLLAGNFHQARLREGPSVPEVVAKLIQE